MKRFLWLTAAIGAVAGVLIVVWMPQARLVLVDAPDDGTVPGVLHIHTNRSDGSGTPDEIAAAAARAGLRFIVFTDHGDATRVPEPPAYRAGVLCIDAVEISTTAGHYVALGLPAAPYPLAGEPRDVVEDVRRLGGFGIAAHPDSPKDGLRWGDWNAPIDGVEIINPDTSWRERVVAPGVRPKLGLVAALGTYLFRAPETIARLLGNPADLASRWDSLTTRRAVVGIAGVDAHAKLEPFDADPGDNRYALPIPGYETALRTLSVHVRPERPFTGDASADAEALVKGIRAGQLYTVVDAIASPASFAFSAQSASHAVEQGGELPGADGAITLRVKSNAPASFAATVRRGNEVLTTDRHEREFTMTAPAGTGAYRVEIRAADRPGQPLWIVSNPIYVREPETSDARPTPPVTEGGVLFPADPFGWTVEHDPRSKADVEVMHGGTGDEVRFDFTLAPEDPRVRPSAAIASAAHALRPNDRLALTLRAERPMRLSVQLRTSVDGSPEERWQRSVYIDSIERLVTVRFDDMTPLGATRSARPPLDASPSVVLAVDLTNARAGSSGQIWIKRVALAR